ncbi:MAG: trigger factor [Microcoleaceae cyanobacterium]
MSEAKVNNFDKRVGWNKIRLQCVVLQIVTTMKVTQEKLPASQIGLDIEIPAELSQKAYDQVVRKYAQTANIPGFRKGKVPRHILVQRLGVNRIKAAALENLMQDHLPKAIEQEDISAIGEIEFRGDIDELIDQYKPGEILTIRAKVDVEPEVELAEYQGWQLQAEEVKYDPSNVDQVLKAEQVKLATLIPIEDRAAQEGDVAFVDFQGYFPEEDESEEADAAEGDADLDEDKLGEGSEDYEPEVDDQGNRLVLISGAGGENFQVKIEEGQFIPGFAEGIIGMQPEETKWIHLTFPEDYSDEDFAGEDVIFKMTLNEIKEEELPELDDEFAEEISDFETLAELQESLEKRYQQEAEDATKDNKEKVLIEALVQQVTVDLPETLIYQEVNQILTQQAIQLSDMGIDVKRMLTGDLLEKMREEARPGAIDRLKQSLAIKEVAKRESIEPSPEEIQEEETKTLELLEGKEVDSDRLREFVTEELTKRKTFEWLEEHSTIELVPEGTLEQQDELSEAQEESEAQGEVEVEVVSAEAQSDELKSAATDAPTENDSEE